MESNHRSCSHHLSQRYVESGFHRAYKCVLRAQIFHNHVLIRSVLRATAIGSLFAIEVWETFRRFANLRLDVTTIKPESRWLVVFHDLIEWTVCLSSPFLFAVIVSSWGKWNCSTVNAVRIQLSQCTCSTMRYQVDDAPAIGGSSLTDR